MKNVKEIIAEKLAGLLDSISVADRQEAEKEVGISRPTLDKYLNGDIVKIETGEKLLEFFAGKVKTRIEKIRETNLV